MEIKKSCENCGYNDGYPCSKWEGCFPYDGAKNWAPDYQTLEAQLDQEKAITKILQDNLRDETDYSHKIQSQIFLRYAELFTNYAFVDHETAIDLMAGEIQTLRTELQQYKEALRLTLSCFGCNDCIYNEARSHPKTVEGCLEFFLTKAKGGRINGD